MKLLTGLPWNSRLGFTLSSYGPNSVLLYKAATPKDGQIELTMNLRTTRLYTTSSYISLTVVHIIQNADT